MKRLATALVVLVFFCPQAALSVTLSKSSHYSSNVSLELTDPSGSIYQEGETVRLKLHTGADAYAVVFDIDTDGFVHLLYPTGDKTLLKLKGKETYGLPADPDASFIVSGRRGMEFVFAVAARDRDAFNEREIGYLLKNEELDDKRKYRIEGDPFLAANRIAKRLIKGIEHKRDVTMAFTYFHVDEPVDFPRYLCERCYDKGWNPYSENMPEYAAVVDFEDSNGLSYPLAQGFERIRDEVAETDDDSAYGYDDGDVTRVVYLYNYPLWDYGYDYYSPFYYYDPFYWSIGHHSYWPYYPYGRGWYFSIGWSWGNPYHHYPYYYSHYSNHHDFGHHYSLRSNYRYKGGSSLYTAMNKPSFFDNLRRKTVNRQTVAGDGKTKPNFFDNLRTRTADKRAYTGEAAKRKTSKIAMRDYYRREIKRRSGGDPNVISTKRPTYKPRHKGKPSIFERMRDRKDDGSIKKRPGMRDRRDGKKSRPSIMERRGSKKSSGTSKKYPRYDRRDSKKKIQKSTSKRSGSKPKVKSSPSKSRSRPSAVKSKSSSSKSRSSSKAKSSGSKKSGGKKRK